MLDQPDIASVAALVGDPTRARMMMALIDGRALTATELALEGGVAPSTASSHLARLTDAGLVSLSQQGRHRYFRLATSEVASAVEALMSIAGNLGRRGAPTGPRDEGLRRARVCYDHLAGEAAVRLLRRLREKRLLAGSDEALTPTGAGEAWCRRIGIDLEELRARRRPICRACLDWSERRTHLAGSLGAALLGRMFALRLARREVGTRALVLSTAGAAFVDRPEMMS